MATKDERRAAEVAVEEYHEAELSKLVVRAGEAVDRHRAGEIDAFEADMAQFQYARAAKALWTFCNARGPNVVAAMIRDDPQTDWWALGAPRTRRTELP